MPDSPAQASTVALNARETHADRDERIYQSLPRLGSSAYLNLLKTATPDELPAQVLATAYRVLFPSRAADAVAQSTRSGKTQCATAWHPRGQRRVGLSRSRSTSGQFMFAAPAIQPSIRRRAGKSRMEKIVSSTRFMIAPPLSTPKTTTSRPCSHDTRWPRSRASSGDPEPSQTRIR